MYIKGSKESEKFHKVDFFFEKSYFLSNCLCGVVKSTYDNIRKFFGQKTPQKFLWTLGVLLWEPPRRVLNKLLNKFSIDVQKCFWSVSFYKKKLFTSNCSSGHLQCSLDNFAKTFRSKTRTIFVKTEKLCETIFFSHEKCFSSTSSLSHVDCSFEKGPEFFTQSWNIFG